MPRKPKQYPVLDSLRDRLGRVPDKDIADEVGLSPSIVGRYRRRHGISAYQGYKFGHDEATAAEGTASGGGKPAASTPQGAPAAPASASAAPAKRRKPRRRKSKLDPFVDLLGKVPDAEVAELAGVTSENVRAFRRRHSIDAGWRSAGPAPVPAAEPASAGPAAAGSAQGYSVSATGLDMDHVIVAADMVEAAMRATAAVRKASPDARVTAIRYLGPAIV